MKTLKLNDSLIVLSTNEIDLESINLPVLESILAEVEMAISIDSALLKHYGIGSVFQTDDSSYNSGLIALLHKLEGNYQLSNLLLNREITSLKELESVFSNVKHPEVALLMEFNCKLFVVYLNSLVIFEDHQIHYQFLAVVIKDTASKPYLSDPVCTLLNILTSEHATAYQVTPLRNFEVGSKLAIYNDHTHLGDVEVGMIWLDGIENEDTENCPSTTRCVIALIGDFNHPELQVGSTFHPISTT